MSETRMLHRNIKLSTTPPSPSQQYCMTCSNITTSAAAQSAGHQLLSKDRTCNWTLHSKDQQLGRGCWSLPFHQSSERKGSADTGISSWTSHVFREYSTRVMTLHLGEQSPSLAALQLNAQHLALHKACMSSCASQRGGRNLCWDLGRKHLKRHSTKCRSSGFPFTGKKIQKVAPS